MAEQKNKTSESKPEVKQEAKASESKPEVKSAKKDELKSEYKVCVTGFHYKGKMFRANKPIKTSQYKTVIEDWLKKGWIR